MLRLLDKSESKLSLEAVGMQGETLRRFTSLIAQPHGIVLVTGPRARARRPRCTPHARAWTPRATTS